LLNVPLYYRYYPFAINFVVKNVLTDVIVPEISFITSFPYALMSSKALAAH
jgi:hypothetical protein